MKDLDKTINRYNTLLKNHEHKSLVSLVTEVRDLLKVIANGNKDGSEVKDAISSAFEKGKPEFEQMMKDVTSTYGDQDGFVLLSHPCQTGEYSLMATEEGKYDTSKIDKPLDGWWLSFEDAQTHKKQGDSMVQCKIPLDKIAAVHNPVTIQDTVNGLVLNGSKKGLMSFSVDPGVYTIKEKYTGEW